jgi:hypothetical protein
MPMIGKAMGHCDIAASLITEGYVTLIRRKDNP